MVVSTHRLGITMRTSLSGPQRRRVLHSDQHFAFLRNVVHSAHTPGIPQRQYLMKHFLGNHPCSLNHPQKPSTHKKRRGTSKFHPTCRLPTVANLSFYKSLMHKNQD